METHNFFPVKFYSFDNEDLVQPTLQTLMECERGLFNIPNTVETTKGDLFEREEFSKGTLHLAKVISESDAYSVIGGGETLTAFNQSNLLDKVGYASTAGGAFLEYIEKGSLPSLDALKEKI